MLIPVDCDKPHMYIITLRATTMKTIQKDTLKSTINKSRCLSNAQGSKKTETEEQEPQKTNRKHIVRWQTSALT